MLQEPSMISLLVAIATAIGFFFRKGIVYCTIWIASYARMKITRRFLKRRLDLYDLFADGQPEKMGFFVPKIEWNLESPQAPNHLRKNLDDVFCMGVNSKSESLALRLVRQTNGTVRCCLTLRLSNGCTYTLPSEHHTQTETDEPHTFGSSRLKMQCLLPMRKWRVFFNGMLRETSGNQEDEERYRHVKFSFIWTASSDVFDYKYDISEKLRATAAAKFWSWKCPPTLLLHRLKRICDGYDQCGMLLGTVTVEGEQEKEVYLWGNRGRYLSRKTKLQEYQALEVYTNYENGTFIRVGLITIPGFLYEFPYGYVMRPNGFVLPIESFKFLKTKGDEDETHFVCSIHDEEFKITLKKDMESSFDEAFGMHTSVSKVSARLNSMIGTGLIFNSKVHDPQETDVRIQKFLRSEHSLKPEYVPFSLSFHEPCCQVLSVSGGKGSSLAKLTCISHELKTFAVPKGIVVTTSAYSRFTETFLHASLKRLEEVVWKKDHIKSDVNAECERVIGEIVKAELPKSVEESIERNLYEFFGKEIKNVRFAVRSSATGEDTEQMSAAGQMETFLGCKEIPEVFTAVKKCWASQFSFVAVEYKRRYGQPLNTPMAVVIQEMVPCDVAGVAFTCDPVTGNPSYVTITANYGLGESVVSASAEPDTLTLKRDLNNRLQFHSKTAGIKQSKIVMDESGGTKEVKLDPERSSEYSISENIALELGDITVKIEMEFGAPRDIEWGVLNEKIFLFQARPVTSIDTESEFEMMHMFDTHLRREDEFSSTANVGEVLPGSISPLGLMYMKEISEVTFERQKQYINWNGESLPKTPYYAKGALYIYNHVLFCLSDAFFKFSESGDEISNYTKAITVAIFGRIIEDKKIFEVSKDRHASERKSGTSLVEIIFMAMYMFFGENFSRRIGKKLEKFRIPVEKSMSATETLRTISEHYHEIHSAMANHMSCTFTSPFWNLSLLTLLSKARGVWDNDVYRDFGYLLSSCKQVESADIPSAIQSLGFIISRSIDAEKFKSFSVDEALEWLQTTPLEAGTKFREFLVRHGHRCFKEFDVYSKTWEMDPRTLVRTLQGVVTKNIEDPMEKKVNSFDHIVSNMHVKLNFFQRLKLRFLLPHCQRGVREREVSKSLIIKGMDKMRAPFYLLADAMVREGRLPSPDLLFFLCPEEIHQLLLTRSPRIVTRAFRRWKCHPEMDKLIFPEMISGIPKPVNMNEDLDISGEGFSMTGVPVSQGVVKGVARVVVNIEDAPNIQHGDILITYSTDIAWSPYFPMLSGVVTELGGLISHGAVVAREYGLPCVVNLHGATRAFKSGDLVLLDGNRGILKKIETL